MFEAGCRAVWLRICVVCCTSLKGHMWSVHVVVSAHDEVAAVGLDTHCVFSSVLMPWSAVSL